MENYSNGLQFDTRGPDTKGVEIASLSTEREVAAPTPREWERERRLVSVERPFTLTYKRSTNQGDPVVPFSLHVISLEMVEKCLSSRL